MGILDWIPAVSTSALLVGVLWLFRHLISTRLTKSVQHEFDHKLEELRTTLRNSEESFKADLRSKEAEIILLRSSAISGLSSRQAALDKRRIEAVEQLWAAVTALASARSVSNIMASIRFEEALKVAADNPKARDVFAAFGGGFDKEKMDTCYREAEKARPFLSPIAWALFSAYQAIVSVAVVQLELLKIGINIPTVIDTAAIKKLISIALPHQAEHINNHSVNSYHYLLDELESRLLGELQNMLQGGEADRATVEQAAAILKESKRVMESDSKAIPNIE
jgi:hypothetical protein